MTSREFIQQQFKNDNGETKTLSSIYKDGKGNIYSYGKHYPLLFSVGGLTFRNCVGYSSTTAKHINWAGDIEPLTVDVWLSGTNLYTWNNPENKSKVPALLSEHQYSDKTDEILKAVFNDLRAELVDINNRIASKKRTDTKIYKDLLAERYDCVDRIASVKPYVKGL